MFKVMGTAPGPTTLPVFSCAGSSSVTMPLDTRTPVPPNSLTKSRRAIPPCFKGSPSCALELTLHLGSCDSFFGMPPPENYRWREFLRLNLDAIQSYLRPLLPSLSSSHSHTHIL